MRKSQYITLLLLSAVCWSTSVFAIVIQTGNLSYDDESGLITSSTSGRYYLNWTELKRLTYQQTVEATTNGLYTEFHIASQAEAYEFYRDATLTDTQDTPGQSDLIVTTVSTTDDVFGQDQDAFELVNLAWFLSDDEAEVGYIQQAANFNIILIRDSWSTIAESDDYADGGTISNSPATWLLVGNDIVDSQVVPAPASYIIMGTGLVAIFLTFALRRIRFTTQLSHLTQQYSNAVSV